MDINATTMPLRAYASDSARYLMNRLQARCHARWSVHRPRFGHELTIATEGFNGNLGDRALLQTTQEVLKDLGWRSRGVAYDHANRWRCGRQGVLMAGGEIGDNFHFRALMSMQPDPKRCAVVGISPTNAFLKEPDEAVLKYLCKVPYLSVRNSAGKLELQKLLDKVCDRGVDLPPVVLGTPDLVFSQAQLGSHRSEIAKSKRVFGINISPLFLNFTSAGRFVFSEDLVPLVAMSSPGLDMKAATAGYVEMIQQLLRLVRSEGYRVVHLPFSAADAAFAAIVDPQWRRGTSFMPAKFSAMVKLMSRCDVVLATRFHGHIAAMIANTPLISMGASGKNIQLLSDMGLPSGWPRDRFKEGEACAEELLASKRVLLPEEQLKHLQQVASLGVQTAAAALTSLR